MPRSRVGKSPTGQVVDTALERLRTWDDNPRLIELQPKEDLKRSMLRNRAMLGVRPLVALPDGVVMLGNQRLVAARELGWKTIPVVFVDIDAETATEWAFVDNNRAGDWDPLALAPMLSKMHAKGLDLALLGFADADLDRILAEFKPPADPDQAPPLSEREPDSKPGEIYRLGPHRVMCGDSRDREQMAALMEGQMAAVYWGDPPWGVGYVGRTPAALTIANDDAEGLLDLLVGAFTAATEALAPGSPFYIASPTGPQGTDFRLALRAVGWRHRQSLAWVKNSLVLGHGDYHNQYEEILFGATPGPGRPGRGRHRGTRWYGGNNQSSVFFVDRPVRSSQHPTQKPVALITAQLRNSSRRGDLVLDSFAGSGSSLIASELLGRRCFAMELSPAYVDVIRRRYAEFVDGRS